MAVENPEQTAASTVVAEKPSTTNIEQTSADTPKVNSPEFAISKVDAQKAAAPKAPASTTNASKATKTGVAVSKAAAQKASATKVDDSKTTAPELVVSKADAPKVGKNTSRETTHSYRVEHDHHIGSCKGTLKIGRDGISFVSEKAKDSFDFRPHQCSYDMDTDHLIIRVQSKVFRFKSATATTSKENTAELLKILDSIDRFHPAQTSSNQ
jgi:hypothetical protein